MKNSVLTLFFLFLLWVAGAPGETKQIGEISLKAGVPILLYHRLGPVVADRMTVTTSHFQSQLKYFRDHGYVVIPLRQLIDHYRGEEMSIPSRAVVITVDDGHKTVYQQ